MRSLQQRDFTAKINQASGPTGENGFQFHQPPADEPRPHFGEEGAKPDRAMLKENGGIDLNSKNLNLQSEGEKVNITFDPVKIAQFKRGDFSGVRIQILDVVPVNLMPLLGLKEEEEVQRQLAKV